MLPHGDGVGGKLASSRREHWCATKLQGAWLKESDFVLAEESDLRTLLAGYAAKCDRLTVFGMTYTDGTGINDPNMNAGQNRDGAVVFYFGALNDGPMARWVFLKFQNPVLRE